MLVKETISHRFFYGKEITFLKEVISLYMFVSAFGNNQNLKEKVKL